MWGEGSERGLCCCLASGDLPGTCPISSYFTHLLYVTGTLSIVALVMKPRVGGSVWVLSLCGPFKWGLLKIYQFLLPSQLPVIFIARSYGDLSSLPWDSGLCGLVWGWDHSLPRYLSWFLPTIHGGGTTCNSFSAPHCISMSLHLSLWLCPSYPSGWLWLF